jgi:hypothetical protein
MRCIVLRTLAVSCPSKRVVLPLRLHARNNFMEFILDLKIKNAKKKAHNMLTSHASKIYLLSRHILGGEGVSFYAAHAEVRKVCSPWIEHIMRTLFAVCTKRYAHFSLALKLYHAAPKWVNLAHMQSELKMLILCGLMCQNTIYVRLFEVYSKILPDTLQKNGSTTCSLRPTLNK